MIWSRLKLRAWSATTVSSRSTTMRSAWERTSTIRPAARASTL
jgi:hypothetical protein